MSEFTKRELIGSLLCPFLTFLWGAIRFVNDHFILGMEITGRGTFRLMYIVAISLAAFCLRSLHLRLKYIPKGTLKKAYRNRICAYF